MYARIPDLFLLKTVHPCSVLSQSASDQYTTMLAKSHGWLLASFVATHQGIADPDRGLSVEREAARYSHMVTCGMRHIHTLAVGSQDLPAATSFS